MKILAAFIVVGFFLSGAVSYGQEADGSLSIGSLRTTAEEQALRLAIEFGENLSVEKLVFGDNSILDLEPDITILTGDADAFNGIVVKLVGYKAFFKTTIIEGVETPASGEWMHILPLSFGLEADDRFDNVNALAEFGYVPFGPASSNERRRHRLGLNPRFGVFIQAGYKFEVDPDAMTRTGGAVDESEEEPDSAIARLKADFRYKTPMWKIRGDKTGILVIVSVIGWYDIANSETYDREVATLRLKLTDKQSFDLVYEHGSGAPNFNEGAQFSANLTINF